MNNYRVIIDAAHGGDDIGGLLFNIPEKNIVLDLSKYMYQKFKNLRVPVSLIRETDETIPFDERIRRVTTLYGDHKYVIVISNHVDVNQEYRVVYGLKNNAQLANYVSSALLHNQEKVSCKVKRWGLHANQDFYKIHRNIANMQTLRITYPFMQNRSDLDKGVDIIVNAIYGYIGGCNDGYEVVEGDTLWNIAKKFQIGVDELKALNGFTDNLLRTGDRIKVKHDYKDIGYTVCLGENMYQISKKFNIEIEELMQYNHKKSNLVKVGEVLYIPNKVVSHVIKKGDNLYQLSKDYGRSVEEILNNNNLMNEVLEEGKVIMV